MAALTTSAFAGVKLNAKKVSARRAARPAKVSAKYGDESVYFDLKDIESTVGSWDLYGQDSPKRYPDTQSEFWERAGTGLSRRGAMFSFIATSGIGAILAFGAKGSKDAKLPITIGPLTKGEAGPNGKI